jgi:penicillin-binding protein 1A
MKVYTTLRRIDQRAAMEGAKRAVLEFQRRRGYAGPEGKIKLPDDAASADKAIEEALMDREEVNGLLPGVIIGLDKQGIRVRLRSGEDINLGASEIKFAQRFISGKVSADLRLGKGSIVRVAKLGASPPWQLTYLPQVEVGFIALSPENGAVRAMVGSFDFTRNQYNHVTQAWRQAGSSFKPFVYSAALERGVTPTTLFDDAPIAIDPAETGGVAWEPKNFDGTMDGPTTLRNALTKSKNLVSIRVLQAATVPFTHDYVAKFGFDMGRIPPYLTMALGAGEVTPLSLAKGYAVFANGGHRVTPWHLLKVTDKDGHVLESFTAPASTQVIDARNAFTMASMMQDVVRRGTATGAMKLGRTDLAGKTGTTNDHRDTWFAGFQATRIAVAWMGYDQPRPLGGSETGGVTALPMWVHYMGEVLKRTPQMPFSVPSGLVALQVDPATGQTLSDGQGMTEYVYHEFAPGAPPPPEVPEPSQDGQTPP